MTNTNSQFGEQEAIDMGLKRIRFLIDTYGKSEGDTATIRLETEGAIYYYDCFRRWCYAYKTEEGTTFEYIKQRKNNTKE